VYQLFLAARDVRREELQNILTIICGLALFLAQGVVRSQLAIITVEING
jgi:hypothetical protein